MEPSQRVRRSYLNADMHVAAANARVRHVGRAIKLFDLLPEARPELVTFDVPWLNVLDACTRKGIAALGFADNFPYHVHVPGILIRKDTFRLKAEQL